MIRDPKVRMVHVEQMGDRCWWGPGRSLRRKQLIEGYTRGSGPYRPVDVVHSLDH